MILLLAQPKARFQYSARVANGEHLQYYPPAQDGATDVNIYSTPSSNMNISACNDRSVSRQHAGPSWKHYLLCFIYLGRKTTFKRC